MMNETKKCSLLARIDGQIAGATMTDEVSMAGRLQRIGGAMKTLRSALHQPFEYDMFARLERHIARLREGINEGRPEQLMTHYRTMARSECVLWQLRLRDDDRRESKQLADVAEA